MTRLTTEQLIEALADNVRLYSNTPSDWRDSLDALSQSAFDRAHEKATEELLAELDASETAETARAAEQQQIADDCRELLPLPNWRGK